jgi:FtsZ-binding cell division protein ZapB
LPDEPKPPYVRFETRSEEDRQASIEAGHYVGKDVIFAIVTPAGTRDVIERKVEDWFANIEEGVKQERIPGWWMESYRRSLDNYKAQRDDPEVGMPIKDWPGATPSQIRTMLDIGVRTVEDLAAANEETLGRIGMGARALKQKAATWLQDSQDVGKNAERIGALQTENEQLKETIAELMDRLQKVEDKQKETV